VEVTVPFTADKTKKDASATLALELKANVDKKTEKTESFQLYAGFGSSSFKTQDACKPDEKKPDEKK
jgi:hypothetical protein